MLTGLAALMMGLPIILHPFIQTPLVAQATLSRLRISLTLYTAINLVAGLLFLLGFVTVAGMIYVRKPNDWMALFVAFFLVAFSLTTPLVRLKPLNLPRLWPSSSLQ